jgi:hypothetical protein
MTNWKRWIADIHLWLSLLVGLQVLAWMVSGLIMVSQPIERVRSEHRMAHAMHVDLASQGPVVSPGEIIAAGNAPVQRLTLEMAGGRVVYVAEGADAAKILFDARTGARISPIDEALARTIADAAIAGDAPIASARLIDADPPIEYRGALPAWRIDFADRDNLAVYVDASTGRVTARRSDLWRVFDVMWMFHIMDYREREDSSHPLLIVAAALSLAMTIAGLVLLAIRLPQRYARKSG